MSSIGEASGSGSGGGASGSYIPGSATPSSLTSPLQKTKSRHVQLVEASGAALRERQWSTGGPGRPRPSPMVRSPSAYSARSAYSAYSRAQYTSSGARTPIDPHSPRASISTFHLQHLLESLEMDQYDTFGVEELRDGFFDATFYRSTAQQGGEDGGSSDDEDGGFFGVDPGKHFRSTVHTQIEDCGYFFTTAFRSRSGIRLMKACLGYFIAYVFCLIPQIQSVLGKHSYWVPIAALFNHAGRTVGAQIDGTVGCMLGGAFGLGFGCLALEAASATAASRSAYGGVLAAFLIPIIALLSWVRCSLLRFYQGIIAAGIALMFLCLVETDDIPREGSLTRPIVREFAVPWLVGLGISLVVNLCLYPEAGSRVIATALHDSMESALRALVLPRTYSLEIHSNMSKQLVNLSDAVRDMRNEATITALEPADVEQLRNLLQSVIRQIMAIKPETSLFDHESCQPPSTPSGVDNPHDVIINIHSGDSVDVASIDGESTYETPLEVVRQTMAEPARNLVTTMAAMLRCCDNALMRIAGLADLFDHEELFDVELSREELKSAIDAFDRADAILIEHPSLPSSYSTHADLVELFLFINPLRQAAGAIDSLADRVLQMSRDPKARRKRIFLPSYPFWKAIYRTNPQVRHDRGGVSAGYYFRIKGEINSIMGKIHARAYHPDPDGGPADEGMWRKQAGIDGTADGDTLRYRTWKILHRLQQFETKFAVKVVLVTATLSAPAWLRQSSDWWRAHDSWWAVIAAWLMMHPRVGGNAQDLLTRTIATVVGAAWGGFAYGAGSAAGPGGRPYVLAAFAFVFMIPAVFRFMLSSHPRSGLMTCLSFTIVSLTAHNQPEAGQSAAEVASLLGIGLVIGVVAAVAVNWVVWPFVARHELRKSLSDMLLNLGIAYRGVVARYIYHDADYHPTREDIEMSEIQEAKLREYCFRMRELSDMTRHEIRPRGPFHPAPYNAAIDACERFLEHIIEVRQASLYFHPFLFQDSEDATRKMLSPRRDAVASILMNLYVLAGALRSKRPVPRYLPSAAAARKTLLDRMSEIEAEYEEERLVRPRSDKTRRWADVYHYAYSAALTDIVAQIEVLERLIKAIIGEMALDAPDAHG